jgi:hypothetical protein
MIVLCDLHSRITYDTVHKEGQSIIMQRIHFSRSLNSITRAALALLMLALALLGSARPAAAASNISATPLASGFSVRAHSDTSVTWELQVSSSPVLQGSQPLFLNAIITYASSQGSAQTDFVPFVGGLVPNTTYNYILKAGNTYTYGVLGKTLHRSVVVSFNSITVSGDSDSVGKGELTYQFKVNGVYHPELDFFRATSSGETFNPGKFVSNLIDGGATMPLAVDVQDDDCEFSTCVRKADFTSGSNSDNDWATAAASIDFSAQQVNSFNKTVSYSVNKAVAFNGTALVKVLYS